MKRELNFKNLAKTGGILLTGLLLGWMFFGGSSAEKVNMDQHIAEAHTDEEGDIVYTCAMHPQIRQSEPGNCPICGMELIPVSSSEENPQALTMTSIAMKLADVATTPVVRQVAVKKIRMPGKVAVDERKVSVISANFSGRVEELYVNFTGAYVEKGDKLASIYSPELVTAQKELLQAYQVRNSNPALYRAARQKLENWEVSDQQIEQIIQTGEPQTNFVVRANQSGYVMTRNIAVGNYITAGKPMFKVADLSTVWVLFQANENDLLGLDTGDKVAFTVQSYPGRTFEAEVTYIDPIVNKDRRTVSVRTEIDNKNGLLKPNMLAKGVISAMLYEDKPVLQIPKSAVMWTGKRSIVYVKKPDSDQPAFKAQEVVLGPSLGDSYVILEGLEAGEKVVVQGNFMIDAASQLAGKLSMMNRESGKTIQPEHKHGMMEMNTSATDTNAHQHTEHLSILLDHYLKMKNALTKDNFEKAKHHLKDLKAEVIKSSEMNNHPKHSQMHKKHHAAMVEAITSASNAKNIDQFRAAFSAISDNLVKAIQNQNYEQQELYLQYCPMAVNKEGAYWVSEQKEIINPYMGQKMPGCGEITKEL